MNNFYLYYNNMYFVNSIFLFIGIVKGEKHSVLMKINMSGVRSEGGISCEVSKKTPQLQI
jgi:hypothetical protein